MKTRLLFTGALLFLAGIFNSSAQTETRLGAMVAYGTEIENPGIGVTAEFPIIEDLTIAPGFIYYLPKDESGVSLNWWEINGNANYYFVNTESLGFYGLAGLNYSHVGVDYDGSGFGGASMSVSDGRFGLNLGAGANFDIGSSIIPFAEAKYVIIDGGQLVIGAGVKFDL
ncbi:outer membrane protein [Autumnicola psychrophila]|uniref:Outer membrane beta-barrel protein n=1 Tax=Autumnicola psychrophila TaxID=3075592 RepID=A0ABU3DVH9_9FLAO|nr:outer membrane beta-barrel protein [Zunongwangia sp. F225]MDT0687714.1 outer membrane beta-barrel protein [Zunongwangia sp. F225]